MPSIYILPSFRHHNNVKQKNFKEGFFNALSNVQIYLTNRK